MTERIDLIIAANEEAAVNAFQATNDAAVKLQKTYDDVSKSGQGLFDDVIKANDDYTKSLDNTVKETAKYEKANAELKKEISGLSKEIDTARIRIGSLDVSIGSIREGYNKWKGIMSEAFSELRNGVKITEDQRKGVDTLTKTLGGGRRGFTLIAQGARLFRTALIATGVGAFVVVLGSLLAFLTRTQEGVQLVNRTFAQFGAATDVIVDRLSDFGETIVNTFSEGGVIGVLKSFGNAILENVVNRFKSALVFGEAIAEVFENGLTAGLNKASEAAIQFTTGLDGDQQRDFANAISETTEEINKEAAAAGRLSDALFNLEKAEIAQISRTAKIRAEIKELNKVAEDTTKTYQEREEAARSAGQLSVDLVNQEVGLQRERVRILEQQQALGKNSLEDDRELAQERAKIYQLEEAALEQQTTLQNKLNTIRGEQQAKIDALTKSLEKLNTVVTQSNLEQLEPAERLSAEYEAALIEVESFAQAIEEQAKEIGQDVDISDEIDQLKENIRKEFAEKFKELREDDSIVNPLPTTLQQGAEVEVTLTPTTVEPRENIIKRLLEKLGLDEEGLKQIGESAREILSIVANGIIENTQRQIEQQNELIADLEAGVDRTEAALNRELQLKINRRANDYDLLKKDLEEQTALIEREEEKRDELRKKALIQQQVADQLSQASSLGVAIANIFKSNTTVPIVGVFAALAQVATMIASFRSFQQEVRTLRHGTNPFELIPKQKRHGLPMPGRTHEGGGEIVEIERDEIVMSTLASRKNAKLLGNIERGKYDRINLLSLAEQAVSIGNRFDRQSTYAANAASDFATKPGASKQEMKEAMIEALTDTNPALIAAIISRPETVPAGEGKVMEIQRDSRGNIVYEGVRDVPK